MYDLMLMFSVCIYIYIKAINEIIKALYVRTLKILTRKIECIETSVNRKAIRK